MPIDRSYSQEHSEEVQEIISSVPNWLIRWGISLFFLLLLLLLVFAYFLKSPDIVPAKLRIDNLNPPQEVLARREGRLVRLFVKDGQLVRKGQILGFMESNAEHDEVLELSRSIDELSENIHKKDYASIRGINFNSNSHYGELQTVLQDFYLSFLKFNAYSPTGIYYQKEHVIKEEIQSLEMLEEQLVIQENINKKELAISREEFMTNEKLALNNVISPHEFRQQERKYLTSQLPLHGTRTALINNRISQTQKRKELMEIEHELNEEHLRFEAEIQRFKSEIDNWKRDNILIAEKDGVIMFHELIREGQWVKVNTPVMYINEFSNKSDPYGELRLSQNSFGKIKEGQEVLIRLNAYPAQEFGLLKGRITFISNAISGDTTYLAIVTIPEKTTYNKTINLKVGLVAHAEVITANKSVLSRLFETLQDITFNQ